MLVHDARSPGHPSATLQRIVDMTPRDLLGGEEGNYNSLSARCRAPGGCMVATRYTKRAHTETCTESPIANCSCRCLCLRENAR